MVKKSASPQQETSPIAQEGGFPVPFSIEELRSNILYFFLTQVRSIGWMTDAATAWRITGKPEVTASELFDPDMTPGDLELTYADISETMFARCMESLYQFAYFGVLDESIESMSYESIYTWLTAIVDDTARGRVMTEWDSYGAFGAMDTSNLYRVAETANARRILEGLEHFYYFEGKDGDQTDNDALNVRQMALLAGMEEMSVRAAAGPSRGSNRLTTYKEGGHTRISIEEAKRWLQAKGRYIPVTRRWTRKEIDFTTRRFSSFDDMLQVAMNRRAELMRQDPSDDFYNAFSALFNKYGLTPEEPHACFSHKQYVRELAEVLRFPVDLFCLRVRELLVKEESDAVRRALQELSQSTTV